MFSHAPKVFREILHYHSEKVGKATRGFDCVRVSWLIGVLCSAKRLRKENKRASRTEDRS